MDSSKNAETSEPMLRNHVYDGIQEYDQKLPNWWLFTWYITMVWFLIAWLAYYQFGFGRTDGGKIAAAMAKIDAARAKELEGIDDAKLWAMSRDPQVTAAGKATFTTYCVACHAPDLSATLAGNKLPGLPLNDTEWKFGGHPVQIMNLVRKGSPDPTKGMPTWEPQLGIQRVVEVVSYVLSHHQEGESFTLAADSPLKENAQPNPAAAPAPAPTPAPAPAGSNGGAPKS